MERSCYGAWLVQMGDGFMDDVLQASVNGRLLCRALHMAVSIAVHSNQALSRLLSAVGCQSVTARPLDSESTFSICEITITDKSFLFPLFFQVNTSKIPATAHIKECTGFM